MSGAFTQRCTNVACPFAGRRGTIMGKAGGVAALREKMRQRQMAGTAPKRSASVSDASRPAPSADADDDGSRPLAFARRSTTALGQRGYVRAQRLSHIEMQEDAAREGPVSKALLLAKAEAEAGEKQGGKIVIYTTSVTGMMETKIRCNEMRGIFQRLRVRFEERNTYMTRAIKEELQERLPKAVVPQCFFNGEHLGDFDTILQMNETGALQKLTKRMEKIEVNVTGECPDCSGEGFVLCNWCGGDKRKSMAVEFNRDVTAFLKCTACNENGLMLCKSCMTQVSTA